MKYIVSFIIVYLSFGEYDTANHKFNAPYEKMVMTFYNRDAGQMLYDVQRKTQYDSINRMYIIDSVKIDSTDEHR